MRKTEKQPNGFKPQNKGHRTVRAQQEAHERKVQKRNHIRVRHLLDKSPISSPSPNVEVEQMIAEEYANEDGPTALPNSPADSDRSAIARKQTYLNSPGLVDFGSSDVAREDRGLSNTDSNVNRSGSAVEASLQRV